MHELKYREVKVIDSSNTDMNYARNVMRQQTLQEEKQGWKKFGKLTCVYDENLDNYLLIQVLIK